MSWLGRVAAAAGRATVRLVPPARRDWAEAVLAEAHQVPAGWPRLAWRAGGARLIAKEAMVVRRSGVILLFAAAAGAATWAAWPGYGGHAAVARTDIIATVLLVAGLPLLTRWLLGPPGNRAARWLRAVGYAAILALMPAKATIELFLGAVPRGGIDLHTLERFQCPWPFTSVAAAVSNCHQVPGTSAGGPSWARRCHVPDDPGQASVVRTWQGFAAGVVSCGTGAVVVTVFGTGTTALLVRSAWVRGLLYHGQHLTSSAVYGRELFATQDVAGYAFLCFAFAIIGLVMGAVVAGFAHATGPLASGGRPPGPPGPSEPEPPPDPPDGGRLADAGADQDKLPHAAAADADLVHQRDEPRTVAVLARAQYSGDGLTAPVCGQVHLGSHHAAGTAQSLRPPAARIRVTRRRPPEPVPRAGRARLRTRAGARCHPHQ
jgi:hypothetical protein